MAGREMMVRPAFIYVSLAAGVMLAGAALTRTSVAATQANPDTNTLPTGIAPPAGAPAPTTLTPGVIDPAPTDTRAPPSVRELRGNPLWAIPLKVLTATRERPLFLPSRRAPAPAVAGPPPVTPVAAPPPPPAPPERPHLTLVGAIVGESESFAILLDETTREVLRLKTGENRAGWVLQSVRAREATLQKDRESIVLSLPAPGDLPQRPPANANTDNL
jgi:general secretion pathway protein N